MPNMPVPAVFVYGEFGPDDLRIVVMVRRRSQLQTIGQVVAALNGVLEVLSALRGLFAVASLLVDGLQTLAELVSMTPRATISVGDIPDLEAHDDLANVGGDAVLFGVSGTWVRLYDDTNYEDNTFEIVVPDTTISGVVELNVGYRYVDHISRHWDDNQAESVHWEGEPTDLSALRPQVP
jgi:hypothetical protein